MAGEKETLTISVFYSIRILRHVNNDVMLFK